MSRDLDWDGCFNVRDLGGIETLDGARIRWGAAIRADSLHKLSADGWAALVQHGVRTVIDLRNDFECAPDVAPRPEEVTTVHLALDGFDDREFWDPIIAERQFGTPLYYRPHLERMPQRSAAVLSAFARARPGGVAFHCVGGRDRSGQITILLLALAGVGTDVIIADYELSDERLKPMWRANGGPDEAADRARFLAEQGTSAGTLIASLLEALDIESTLGAAGLTDGDLRALRARLRDDQYL